MQTILKKTLSPRTIPLVICLFSHSRAVPMSEAFTPDAGLHGADGFPAPGHGRSMESPDRTDQESGDKDAGQKGTGQKGVGDDRRLLTHLYRRCFAKLAADLRAAYGAGPPDPEEIAQRAFEKLGQRGNLGDIRDPEKYVWVCARNIAVTEKRAEGMRARNRAEVERRMAATPCDTADPERVFNAKQQLSLIVETLKQMPERRRRIFILNRVHGLSPREAGRRCGVRAAAGRT